MLDPLLNILYTTSVILNDKDGMGKRTLIRSFPFSFFPYTSETFSWIAKLIPLRACATHGPEKGPKKLHINFSLYLSNATSALFFQTLPPATHGPDSESEYAQSAFH